MSAHHARDEAAVIGLLIPSHHEDPDPLAGLPLEQLPHVGVAVHRGLLAPDKADASEHTPASDVDQLRGLKKTFSNCSVLREKRES